MLNTCPFDNQTIQSKTPNYALNQAVSNRALYTKLYPDLRNESDIFENKQTEAAQVAMNTFYPEAKEFFRMLT